MRIDVVTVFPEMIEQSISHSIVKRARESGALDIRVANLRDFTHNKHRTTDDSPYGGGVGMVMKIDPIDACITSLKEEQQGSDVCVILMSPAGERLDQRIVEELSGHESLTLVCGHYEGVDERVREHLVDREISIGDYVLTGGELPALVLMDAVARLQPGVLGKDESSHDESFSSGLLEYPHYTRPEEFRGWRVPDVLISGHHANIQLWRHQESLRRTLESRPDLLPKASLDRKDIQFLERIGADQELLDALIRSVEGM